LRQVLLPRQGAQTGVRAHQHRGRLRIEEVRHAADPIPDHRGLRQQVVAVDPPGPGIGARRISQHHQPVGQIPVRINARPAGLLHRQLSPDSFDPDHQLRVGPAKHAVDQLQQLQRRLQLLLALISSVCSSKSPKSSNCAPERRIGNSVIRAASLVSGPE
jgi:hypothetical protein